MGRWGSNEWNFHAHNGMLGMGSFALLVGQLLRDSFGFTLLLKPKFLGQIAVYCNLDWQDCWWSKMVRL